MSNITPLAIASSSGDPIARTLAAVRARTAELAAPLSAEDACVQSMPDASPAKWHLAHTTWFFEHFLLAARDPGYQAFCKGFEFLFNSYYFTVGQMHQRPRRGLVTRPSLDEVLAYRAHVDEALQRLLERERGDAGLEALVTLGMHHEQQHQELLLTDIKHLFAQNPLLPAYAERSPAASRTTTGATLGTTTPLTWIPGTAGLAMIGHAGGGFAFDNETPRHQALLGAFSVASRLATNGEFREFIEDGGYANTALWLSDGWSTVANEGWRRPLYWQADLEQEFTLRGLAPIDPAAPVSHLSYYEADAFARWAGCRLPTEFEWESIAASLPVDGNFADSGALHPRPATGDTAPRQFYGDAWEWTASPYAPYPGFRPLAGSLGEYNGKFMCSQMVLRGGSCATPAGHVRASYRNFFYPGQRWQFSGVRLARDGA